MRSFWYPWNLRGVSFAHIMSRIGLLLVCSALCFLFGSSDFFAMAEDGALDILDGRGWIEEMKQEDLGPFKRLRWFCKDGEVLAPRPGACWKHGGGVQHGEWNERTTELRSAGYPIATVFAALGADDFVRFRNNPHYLAPLVLERFLIASDDGWILRKARYYRGAVQTEDENASAEKLMLLLLSDKNWRERHFLFLREAGRLFPRSSGQETLVEIRALATRLARRDSKFVRLKNKIHSYPDASDSDSIREYVGTRGFRGSTSDYLLLAQKIEQVYGLHIASQRLVELARNVQDGSLGMSLRDSALALDRDIPVEVRFRLLSEALFSLREGISRAGKPGVMLAALDVGQQVEQEQFVASRLLAGKLSRARRQDIIDWLDASLKALYGSGYLSARQFNAAKASLERLETTPLSLETYYDELSYLLRIPSWAQAHLGWEFADAVEHLSDIEPLSRTYFDDRLRGSLLLFYSAAVDYLLRDASRLFGIEHRFFDKILSSGLRRLNPGLSRGVLRRPRADGVVAEDPAKSIVLVSETASELPPVAGILTEREGNLLSHVQLLARNLGIPNVVVSEKLLPELKQRLGQAMVLAVSTGGVVEIGEDGPQWAHLFSSSSSKSSVRISPDMSKLDLNDNELRPLHTLSARDSGRIVGPKAAKLAELKARFPDAVADGVAIPFGVFRKMLSRRIEPEGTTLFEWMKHQYLRLDHLKNQPELKSQQTSLFLSRVRKEVLSYRFDAAFRDSLRRAMGAHLGQDGSFGVFVRSDTNVEDLPGFTGAGLNKTMPNVVGFEHVLEAILQVWASPFSERAYAWRQAFMESPEHVYAAVLLLKSVPSAKSGVMVTADIDSGDQRWITIAANEGIGGVVDNQLAETIRIDQGTGVVRLLSQASAQTKLLLSPLGGLVERSTERDERVLDEAELVQLVNFARELTGRFPRIIDASGKPVAADIEFGFVKGRLVLFQIRPFLQSEHTRKNSYLLELDKKLEPKKHLLVNLLEYPLGAVQ